MLEDVAAGGHLPAEIVFVDLAEAGEDGVDESDGNEGGAEPVGARGRGLLHES